MELCSTSVVMVPGFCSRIRGSFWNASSVSGLTVIGTSGLKLSTTALKDSDAVNGTAAPVLSLR